MVVRPDSARRRRASVTQSRRAPASTVPSGRTPGGVCHDLMTVYPTRAIVRRPGAPLVTWLALCVGDVGQELGEERRITEDPLRARGALVCWRR